LQPATTAIAATKKAKGESFLPIPPCRWGRSKHVARLRFASDEVASSFLIAMTKFISIRDFTDCTLQQLQLLQQNLLE